MLRLRRLNYSIWLAAQQEERHGKENKLNEMEKKMNCGWMKIVVILFTDSKHNSLNTNNNKWR